MKSIKQQYIDLKEGRMSQHNFMRSVRMSLPQYITNVTSFNDTVKILKNKGILNEAIGDDPIKARIKSYLAKGYSYIDAIERTAADEGMGEEKEEMLTKKYPQVDVDTEEYEGVDEAYADEAPSYDYNGKKLYVDNQSGEPDEVGGKVSLYDEDENEYVGIISSIDGEGMISVDPKSIQPVEDSELASILAKYGDEDLDGLSPEDYKFQDTNRYLSEKSYNVSKDAIPVSSLKKGDVLKASGLEVTSISAGAKTPSGKIEVTVKDPKTGKETTKIWNKATKVVVKKDLNGAKNKVTENQVTAKQIQDKYNEMFGKNPQTTFADVAKALGVSEQEIAMALLFKGNMPGLNEAKKKKEAKAELNPNAIHPQELRMGIKVELEHTDDLDKAKKIALDHLAENPFYYTALKLAGVESPSAPKYKAPEEKKTRKKKEAVELVDKANAMQKVKMPKVVKEAKLNLFPGEEPNAVVKQAMEWVEANLPSSLSNEIEFQQSRFRPDEAILRYGYWDILPEKAVIDLKSKFNVEADSDEMDDQLPINYYRLTIKDEDKNDEKKTFQKPSFRPGVDLGESFDKFKSTLEEIVREVIAETYDGRDNLDENDGSKEIEKKINTGEIDPQKVKDAAEKAMKGDSTDLALLMALGK